MAMSEFASVAAHRTVTASPRHPSAIGSAPRRPITRPITLALLFASTALSGLAKAIPYSLFASIALSSAATAQDLPIGGTVSAGTASISRGETTVVVNQASQNAAIEWQSFDIAAGNSVSFVQPNANAIALNRVLGADPSVILGSLSANGKVFLVNPNGVLFGKGAQVDVGGLVASTLDLGDADFMAGRYRFSGSGGGAVRNEGSIIADGGYVALLGARVSNDGLIQANLGTVALAAGEAITLDVVGDGLLNVAVETGALAALARNGGVLRANGGTVVMSGDAAGQLLRTAVNNSGLIEARSFENHNGTIRLVGAPGGSAVTVSGSLDVSGAAAGQSGGKIVVTGQAVTLTGTARLDASGHAGGGSILIGGGYQGKDPGVANAATVTMERSVAIHTDATAAGNGGTVVLWSDGDTTALGTISARGGPAGGDGGLVETSGKRVISGGVTVDTLAPRGKAGLWLLDPLDYKIATTGGDETPGQVTLSLATSNRVIQADHDITVADAITWTTPQTLELRAGNDVLVDAAMTASTAGSAMRFVAGRDIVVGGALTASAAGTLIEMNAGEDVVINGALTASGAGALIALNADHDIDLNEAVTASGGGSVVLRADNDGTGGTAGGTVHLSLFPVTSSSVTIYYSPENGYAAPNAYTGFTSYMWAFVGANDKVYDGTVDAVAGFRGDATVGGTVQVALSGGTIAFADENAGSAKQANFSGYTLTGGDAASYALFAGSGVTAAAITPAALAITADNATKTYGDTYTFDGTAFTASGLRNGETIGWVSETSTGAVATASVASGPYAIVASGAAGGTFDAANYITSYVDGGLTITPAALLITADSIAKTYGDVLAFAGSAFTASGLRNGDTVGAVLEASAGAAATANVMDSPYAITASGASGGTFDAANYTTRYADGTLTVTPAALLVRADSATKTYGDLAVFAGGAFTPSGLRNGETIGAVLETSAGAIATASVASGPYAIAASGATGGTFDTDNYVTSYTDGVLSVTPAILVITADNAIKTYGDTHTFDGTAFTASGLRNGETIGQVTEASLGAAVTASVAGGPYAIVASGAAGGTFDAANYVTSYADGLLSVTPATLTITADSAAKTYGDAFTFVGDAFTALGLKNGDTVGAVLEASAGAAPTANVADGPYAIVASDASGGTFNAANYTTSYADGTLILTPAALLIIANDAAKTYGDTYTFAGSAFTASGLKNGEIIGTVTQTSAGTTSSASVADGPYAIVAGDAAGGTLDSGNYVIGYVDGALTVLPIVVTPVVIPPVEPPTGEPPTAPPPVVTVPPIVTPPEVASPGAWPITNPPVMTAALIRSRGDASSEDGVSPLTGLKTPRANPDLVVADGGIALPADQLTAVSPPVKRVLPLALPEPIRAAAKPIVYAPKQSRN